MPFYIYFTHNVYQNERGAMKAAKLSKWGNSLAIRIPIKIAQELDLSENSTLEILAKDDKIIIQKRLSLAQKCQLITAKNRNVDESWDESIGNEW